MKAGEEVIFTYDVQIRVRWTACRLSCGLPVVRHAPTAVTLWLDCCSASSRTRHWTDGAKKPRTLVPAIPTIGRRTASAKGPGPRARPRIPMSR